METTNDEMISTVKILGDINLNEALNAIFTVHDSKAIFQSAKTAYSEMVNEFKASNEITQIPSSVLNFNIEDIYFPEYVLESYDDEYHLVVLTPFGKWVKLQIIRKIENELAAEL